MKLKLREMMKRLELGKSILFGACLLSLLTAWGGSANAASIEQNGLTIKKIRAVGDYEGTTYDTTVEVWFSTPLTWPSGSPCSDVQRAEINANNKHLVAAAYLALSTGKIVNINVDDTLPLRGGTCEISFLDVLN